MDALMICVLAAAMATVGSRWWQLAEATLAGLPGWRGWVPVAASASVAAGAAALLGNGIAAQMRGPGMLLLLALALAFAAAAMAWPLRPLSTKLRSSIRGPGSALILLLAAMLSEGGPFIILAATAWTGQMAWAALGGGAGMIASATLARTTGQAHARRAMQAWRWACAALLAGGAALCAINALGIA